MPDFFSGNGVFRLGTRTSGSILEYSSVLQPLCALRSPAYMGYVDRRASDCWHRLSDRPTVLSLSRWNSVRSSGTQTSHRLLLLQGSDRPLVLEAGISLGDGLHIYLPAGIRLSQHAIAVFHSQWVVNADAADFLLPIAPYVLNGREYAHIGTSTSSPRLSPWEPQSTESSTKRSSLLSEKLSDRPAKKARSELPSKKRKSLPYEDDPSSATLVDEPLTTEIPFIDLYKVASKKTKRKSATCLRISRVSEVKQLRPAEPGTLRFDSGCGPLPRLSVVDALCALQEISIEKSIVIQHGRHHLGKTIRCGFLP